MAARAARATDAYHASPESRNPLVPVPLRPPSPPAPRGGRGPGRGAQRPFANQKNRKVRGIETYSPLVASAELAAALVTTALEAGDRRPFSNSRTSERVAPAQEYHKLAAAAGLEKPACKGLNLGLSVHVERDLVIKVMDCVRLRRRRDSSFLAQMQSKVRAAFAAGASGKKKLNKREQKDVRGPRPII